MSEIKIKSREIKQSLKVLNKQANRFMKKFNINRITWKLGYGYLVKSDIWNKAKQLLIEYKSLEQLRPECLICHNPVDIRKSVLHHNKYNRKRFFKPSYVDFVHYYCHEHFHPAIKRSLIPRYMRNRLLLFSLVFLIIIIITMFSN